MKTGSITDRTAHGERWTAAAGLGCRVCLIVRGRPAIFTSAEALDFARRITALAESVDVRHREEFAAEHAGQHAGLEGVARRIVRGLQTLWPEIRFGVAYDLVCEHLERAEHARVLLGMEEVQAGWSEAERAGREVYPPVPAELKRCQGPRRDRSEFDLES